MEGHNSGLPSLDEPCSACGGTGQAPPGRAYEIRPSLFCSKCAGHKRSPTAAGQQVLEFLKLRFALQPLPPEKPNGF